jgi:RNA polymerase sigma-70 factor (ECF subfamily)
MQISRMHMAGVAGEQSSPGLEETFHRHKDMVFRAAYRVTGDARDAEDVLQTVFLRLVRNPPLPEIRSLPAYLHRAAVNASLDLLRRRKEARTLSLDEESNHVEALSVNSGQPATEIREWLRQALARLNPRWAEMFVLRFIEDYSNREIAGMMETSPAVVAVLLHRTRAQLKKDFKAMTTRRGQR